MKRAVFILILSLWGLQSPGNLSPGYTYLTSVTHCDALCVAPKGISDIKLSTPDWFNKDQYIFSPLNGKHQNLPITSVKTPVILLPQALNIKLVSRPLSLSRRRTNRYKPFLFNHFNNDIKVPP